MNEQKYKYRVQWLVLVGSALLFLLLLGAWISEGSNKEWRHLQKEYIGILKELDQAEGTPQRGNYEKGILQTEPEHLNRVDRCISCHQGLEDSRMSGLPQPHSKHPGSFLNEHPVQRYGCTICHGGQGAALNREDAFGRLPETHWPYPLLEQPYIQSSCGKCHLAIFDTNGADPSGTMNGMEVFLRGKTVFSREGCLGCHKARGVGGIIGPDLTEQGEKTKHEYSFHNVSGEQSVSNWLKEHFKDPEMVSPGSQMLRINLDENELEALATFVMGLSKPDIPFDYFTLATLNEFKGIRDPLDGNEGFAYFCSACHGKKGEGKNYKDYKTGIPAIGNVDFLRIASSDFISFTLKKGRSLRQMGSWASPISGLKDQELDQLPLFLKKKTDLTPETILTGPAGDPEKGSQLFEFYCRTCHGENGRGGVAVALNQKGFLDRADDRFILATMINGRRNSAMPGWFHLDETVLADLLAYIRSWEGASSSGRITELPDGDYEDGALKYHFMCSRCHGEFGEGETGPAIINRDFMEAAGNFYLYETIARGREHTAMFGWSEDVYNEEKLGIQDISNIISFMRISASDTLTYIFQGSNPGNREAGAGLFEKYCSKCHGHSGEGTEAPALNNQEFLSAASNGYIMGTVTIGRKGTLMPSWGYGQEDYPMLSGRERQDLVAFVRSWQRIRIKY